MKILETPQEMSQWSQGRLDEGMTIGLVPTMGYFHEGHLALMRKAGELCDIVVTSLFVNPTQFGPNEDLDRYPKNFKRDVELAAREGVAALFAPTPDSIYPEGFQTEITVKNLTKNLCGASRPVHFAGVATVVTKLFNIVQPTVAVFGEKDYQQVAVIRRLVKDLNMRVQVVSHPIVREADGLAMSSRNANVPPEFREAALSLSRSLQLVKDAFSQGTDDVAELTGIVSGFIESHKGAKVDYVSFVDCDSIEFVERVDERTVMALAVHIDGKARLLDNCFVAQN